MIKVYSTTTCPYCHAVMDWLDNLNIKYEEINAENLPEITAVPTTIIGEEKIIGFDRPKIKKALRKNGLI